MKTLVKTTFLLSLLAALGGLASLQASPTKACQCNPCLCNPCTCK